MDHIINPVSVSLPKPKPKPSSSQHIFNIAEQPVAQWLKSLPNGDKNEMLRRIYRALYEVNRYRQLPREHFNFLEILRKPLLTVLSEMRAQIAIEGYPADQKSYRLAEMANRLYSELIIGYRLVLKTDNSEGWIGRTLRRHRLMTIYYRLFDYYGAIACNYRLMQTHYPKDLWARIHHLYKKARRYRCTRSVITDKDIAIKTTLAHTYKRILMLALLSPGDFRRDQHDSVRVLIADWSRYISLQEHSTTRNNASSVPLLMQRDAPPKAMSTIEAQRCNGKTLHLNIKKLHRRIDRLLKRNNGNTIPFNDERQIPADVLQVLKERLLTLNRPRESRVPCNEHLMVSVGFLAIHEGISGNWRFSPRANEAEQTNSPGTTARRPKKKVQPVDVWDQAFLPAKAIDYVQERASDKTPGNHWIDNARELSLAPLDGWQVDVSLGGCCISLPTPERQRFRVGELVGLKVTDSILWNLGVIRWLHNADNGRWFIGVKNIAVQCVPVHLVVGSDHGLSKPVNCLIARNPEHGLLMYVPYLPGLNKKKLGIIRDMHTCPIELGSRVSFSPMFEAYKFLSVSALEEHHHTLFEDLIELLRATTPEFDLYDGVWIAS